MLVSIDIVFMDHRIAFREYYDCIQCRGATVGEGVHGVDASLYSSPHST
jgi:hypothetical protein